MAYKYSGRIIRTGKSWVDNDGITHPRNWTMWSAETKAEKGVIWEDDPTSSFDSRFYWSADVPRSLEDVTEEDGSITKGLKSNAIATIKQQAAGLLTPSDWYVTRKAETDAEIPSDILTYRQSVREASGAIEAAISGVTTLEAFIALYEAPVDAEGNVGTAPINAWPEA
jgi:hypothetical protein